MKRRITLATMLVLLFVAGMFQLSTSTTAGADNPCRNKCEQGYRSCVKRAGNPGGLNQCKRALDSCLATCG